MNRKNPMVHIGFTGTDFAQHSILRELIDLYPPLEEEESDYYSHFDMRIIDHINVGIYLHEAISDSLREIEPGSQRSTDFARYWRDYLERLEEEIHSGKLASSEIGDG